MTITIQRSDECRKTLFAATSEGNRHSSPRQVWGERRRLMETERAQFGPDGRRSLWRTRVFSAGLATFYTRVRLLRLHRRGRRNALDIQLVTQSISLSDLPRSFDGYRILHLSDTHLDCLPELATVASRRLGRSVRPCRNVGCSRSIRPAGRASPVTESTRDRQTPHPSAGKAPVGNTTEILGAEAEMVHQRDHPLG